MNIETQNAQLSETSRLLFGDAARLAIADPKALVLLKQNARFFKHTMFQQMVFSVKKDKHLSGASLCPIVADEAERISCPVSQSACYEVATLSTSCSIWSARRLWIRARP